MSQSASARAHRALERGLVVREGAERHRLAAGFRDRGRDDRAVAVVDRRRAAARSPGAHQLVAGREHRDLRPPHHVDLGDAAGRQHADLARADARAAPQQRLAARDVGARIGDELPGRDGAAHVDRRRAAVSTSSVCSIITTASAPRGTTPPVAIVVAVPGVDLERRRMAAGDHLGVERAAGAARRRSRRRCRRRATRSRRRWRGRTAARRSARATSCASTRPSASASATRLAGERREIEVPREARARLLGRDHFEELLLPRGAADRGDADRARRDFGSNARHGQGLITTSRAGRIAFAVGRHQNPAVGAAPAPTAADSPRLCGSACAVAHAHRHDLGEPERRGDLARQLGCGTVGSSAADREAAPAGAARAPARPPAPHRAGRAAAAPAAARRSPKAAVSPGASAMPCTSTRPTRASVRTLASLRPLPVPPMAMMASARVIAAARRRARVARACARHDAARRRDRARRSGATAASITASPAAPARTSRTRGSRTVHAADPGRRQHREPERASSAPASPAGCAPASASAPAGSTPSPARDRRETPRRVRRARPPHRAAPPRRRRPAAARPTSTRIGARQRRRRIGAGIGGQARRAPPSRRAARSGTPRIAAALTTSPASDAAERARTASTSRGATGSTSASMRASTSRERRQPRDPLRDFGFIGHRACRLYSVVPGESGASSGSTVADGRKDHQSARAQMSAAGAARAQGADRPQEPATC